MKVKTPPKYKPDDDIYIHLIVKTKGNKLEPIYNILTKEDKITISTKNIAYYFDELLRSK